MDLLPVELVERVLDFLDLPDLIRSAHVAHLWREVAFKRPAFWYNMIVLDVDRLSGPAMDLFIARVNARANRKYCFSVYYMGEPSDFKTGVFRHRALRLLHQTLEWIEKLIIFAPEFLIEDISQQLMSPAPVLHTLWIESSSCFLSDDLLAGVAPVLRDVTLKFVPPSSPNYELRWPSCMKYIATLNLNFLAFADVELDLRTLFESLEGLLLLRRMTIVAERCVDIPSLESPAADAIIGRLNHLDLGLGPTLPQAFILHPGIILMRRIELWDFDQRSVETLLASHMFGSVSMVVSSSPHGRGEAIFVEYTGKYKTRCVKYATRAGKQPANPFAPLIVSAAARCIVYLQINLHRWTDTPMPRFALPRCTGLTLELDGPTLPPLPFEWDVHFPKLAVLFLGNFRLTETELEIPKDEYLAFVAPIRDRVVVHMHGVRVVGIDLKQVWED